MEEQNAGASEQERSDLVENDLTKKGGKNMDAQDHKAAEHEYSFPLATLYAGFVDTWYGTAKKLAESCLSTGEQVAKDAIELQKRATKWAKDTIPPLEEQSEAGREFLDRSASIAHRLLQVQMETGEEAARRAEEMMRRSSRGAA
jgi:hypothetical protein